MKNLAKLEHPATAQDLRRTTRDLVDFVTGYSSFFGNGEVRIINISRLGLMARTSGSLRQGDRAIFALPHVRAVESIVRWAEDGRIGVEFAKAISEADYGVMIAYLPRRPQH